jgi:hypothetical protein
VAVPFVDRGSDLLLNFLCRYFGMSECSLLILVVCAPRIIWGARSALGKLAICFREYGIAETVKLGA